MPIIEDIHAIVNWLDDHMENGPPICGDLYCGTCRGVYGSVKKCMPDDIKLLLHSVMGQASSDQLNYFSIYIPLIEALEPEAYKKLQRNKLLEVNRNDEDSIDYFLIDARHYHTLEEKPFRDLVNHAIEMANESKNESLCETLVIVLRDEIAQHPKLLGLALEFAETDSQMRRAFYNCARKTVPEARKFSKDAEGHFCAGWAYPFIPPDAKKISQIMFSKRKLDFDDN